MKFLPAQYAYFTQGPTARRNLRLLIRLLLLLVALIAAYSIGFHFLMAAEGQRHTWITGFYWTLTVMSTLGFGDITFHTDIGRAFSILVLLSGVIFLLIVLPFTFISFFYAPWLEAQSRMRAPRRVPEGVVDHAILTHFDPVATSLIPMLEARDRRYYVIEPDPAAALALFDQGVSVVVGDRDDIETWRRCRVEDAALVAVTGDDYENTAIAYTVREVSARPPIVSFARSRDSVDVLELAGSSNVLQLAEMLGRSLARRTIGGDIRANVVGRFGALAIAEAPVTGLPMIGQTLGQGQLRNATGLTVVGTWTRGQFAVASRDTVIEPATVLVLAGTDEQLARFAEITAIYTLPDEPIVILGGGRVGRAAARGLAERGLQWRIVEKDESRVRQPDNYIIGSAADLEVIERAGIRQTPTVIVTTADDATNIYLTIYCRRLRPDLQIISRATLERNTSTLHRAGADFVMSYASMGANAVYNVLERGHILMVAEGLDVFRCPVPKRLAGRTLEQSGIREKTGCSVIAIEQDGESIVNPPGTVQLPDEGTAELIVIGTPAGERLFLGSFAD